MPDVAVKVLRESTLAEFPAGKGDTVQLRLVEFESIPAFDSIIRRFSTWNEAGEQIPT